MKMSENIVCPRLRISPCGGTDEHQHLNCPPKYAATGKLPDADWVKRLCTGNFRSCKYYSRRNESGTDNNMCCRHLQINEGDTSDHNHFTCGPKYEAELQIPTALEVHSLCLGDFHTCKYYNASLVLLEGTEGHDN